MKRTTTLRKLLAVSAGLFIFYVFNLVLDQLLVDVLPVGMSFVLDQSLESSGLRLPVPAVFTITKLLSSFFAGATGAVILKHRSYFLLSLPVLLVELPLLYVGFGEGGWYLVTQYLLATIIPVVASCMLGVWLGASDDPH